MRSFQAEQSDHVNALAKKLGIPQGKVYRYLVITEDLEGQNPLKDLSLAVESIWNRPKKQEAWDTFEEKVTARHIAEMPPEKKQPLLDQAANILLQRSLSLPHSELLKALPPLRLSDAQTLKPLLRIAARQLLDKIENRAALNESWIERSLDPLIASLRKSAMTEAERAAAKAQANEKITVRTEKIIKENNLPSFDLGEGKLHELREKIIHAQLMGKKLDDGWFSTNVDLNLALLAINAMSHSYSAAVTAKMRDAQKIVLEQEHRLLSLLVERMSGDPNRERNKPAYRRLALLLIAARLMTNQPVDERWLHEEFDAPFLAGNYRAAIADLQKQKKEHFEFTFDPSPSQLTLNALAAMEGSIRDSEARTKAIPAQALINRAVKERLEKVLPLLPGPAPGLGHLIQKTLRSVVGASALGSVSRPEEYLRQNFDEQVAKLCLLDDAFEKNSKLSDQMHALLQTRIRELFGSNSELKLTPLEERQLLTRLAARSLLGYPITTEWKEKNLDQALTRWKYDQLSEKERAPLFSEARKTTQNRLRELIHRYPLARKKEHQIRAVIKHSQITLELVTKTIAAARLQGKELGESWFESNVDPQLTEAISQSNLRTKPQIEDQQRQAAEFIEAHFKQLGANPLPHDMAPLEVAKNAALDIAVLRLITGQPLDQKWIAETLNPQIWEIVSAETLVGFKPDEE